MILYAIIITYVFPIFVHFDIRTFDYIKLPFIIGIVHPILTIVLIVGIGILVNILLTTIPAMLFFFGGSGISYIVRYEVNLTISKYKAEEECAILIKKYRSNYHDTKDKKDNTQQ